MSEPSLYAARLREGMKQHPRGPLTIDDLRQALGRSYQHYWRILNGEPVISRQLNDQLCHFLELRPDEMWAIAEAEKAARRELRPATLPNDERLQAVWSRLSRGHQRLLVQIAESFAVADERLPDGPSA